MTLNRNKFNSILLSKERLDVLKDCLFLAAVISLSFLPYIFQLGFYSDDWSFLVEFDLSEDRSFQGIFNAANSPHVRMRPVQIAYLAALYWLFGFDPLGYHLINSLIIIANAIILYLILVELKQPRYFALFIPLVYSFLPHYSTNRFWYAAFQTSLSMLLYFLSLYIDLKIDRFNSWKIWALKSLSIIFLFASALAYEVTIPLFILNIGILWYHYYQNLGENRKPISKTNFIILSVIQISGVFLSFLFKIKTTTRASVPDSTWNHIIRISRRLFSPFYSYEDYGFNLKHSIYVNYIESTLKLPFVALDLLINNPKIIVIVICFLFSVITFWYAKKIHITETLCLKNRDYFRIFLLGFLLFFWGYSIFLLSFNVQFTPTGIGNRTAFGAAVGVSLSIVSGIALISNLLFRSSASRKTFCLSLILIICSSGFLVNSILGRMWVQAYQKQQVIISQIVNIIPFPNTNLAIILDGVCPYIGPAIVFESNWDLASALKIRYRTYDLRADIIKPSVRVDETGIFTSIYNQTEHYLYNEFEIFNALEEKLYPIRNYSDALNYFESQNSNYNEGFCPYATEGIGEKVF